MRAEGDTSTKGARDCTVFEGRHSSPQGLLPIQKVPRNINSCVTGFVCYWQVLQVLFCYWQVLTLIAQRHGPSKNKKLAGRNTTLLIETVSREMKCYYERTTDITKEAYTSNPEPKRQAVKSRYTKLRN